MKARRLRTQLTLGMLFFFVGAFGFIYGGTRTLDAWLRVYDTPEAVVAGLPQLAPPAVRRWLRLGET